VYGAVLERQKRLIEDAFAAIAPEALAAGKHVVCEKPLARTSSDAKVIADAAARHPKQVFMPAMCMRFWAEWEWLKQAVAEERYGKVRSATFRRVGSIPAGWFRDGKASGGGLLDLHIHDTDFVQFCFGRPRSVFSTGYSKFSGAIDHVVTQYDVASCPNVTAEGSWAMAPGFGFSMTYTVNFERATADYDLARGADALKLFEEGQAGRTIALTGPDGYVLELQHLIEAIRTGARPNVVTPEDGLNAVEICEAEERSVNQRQIVSLA
jgi:predicted dehydrogenase